MNPHPEPHAPNRFAVIPTHARLDAETAYAGRGVTVAFLDSGFRLHPDLSGRVLEYQDLTGEEPALEETRPPEPWHWHGTMVSVVACGDGRLSAGFYRGLAHEARLVLLKASSRGRVGEAEIARGLRWATEHRERLGIRVVNVSLGGDFDAPHAESEADRAAEEAVGAGLVVVAAAGNRGCEESHAAIPPANSPSVLTVGGYDDSNTLDAADDRAYCSNYGPTADRLHKPEVIAPAAWVAAPILPGTTDFVTAEKLSRLVAAPDYALARTVGELWGAEVPEELRAAHPEELRAAAEQLLRRARVVAAHYQHADGTSFAAPVVTSVVAQMLEANPRLSPAAVKRIIIATARRLPRIDPARQGFGLVDARRAVAEARREGHLFEGESFGPPQLAGGGAHFYFHDDAAAQVALAGDFNGWDPLRAPLARGADGLWRVYVPALAPGRYRYKFVLDGARWVEDHAHNLREPDGLGGFNSILEVGRE